LSELASIADSLDAPTGSITESSIPDPWARQIRFERALFDRLHPSHEQIQGEWRGALSTIALREVRSFDLKLERIKIETELREPHSFLSTLLSLRPGLRNDSHGGSRETYIYIVLLKGTAIAVSSPACLLFTGQSYSQLLKGTISWLGPEGFLDPQPYLNLTERLELSGWLRLLAQDLQSEISIFLSDSRRRLISAITDFANDLTTESTHEIQKGEIGIGFTEGIYRYMDRAIAPLAKPSSEAQQSLVDSSVRAFLNSPILETEWGELRYLYSFLGDSIATSSDVLPSFLQLLQHADDDLRSRAARCIGILAGGDSSAVPALLRCLSDPSPTVRISAVTSLGKMGAPNAEIISGLVAALRDEDASVRQNTAEVLGSLRAIEAISPLNLSLKDPDPAVRVAASRALGLMESLARAVPVSVAIIGNSGLYVNKPDKVRLSISNRTEEVIRNIVIEIEDTPKYDIDEVRERRKAVISQIPPAGDQTLEFSITVRTTGLIGLQLRVNGEICKQASLELYAVENNPYFCGPPIEDRMNYYGHEGDIAKCLQNILLPNGKGTMIIGEQRSGKTSFLNMIRQRLPGNFISIDASMSGVTGDTLSVLSWLLDTINRGLQSRDLQYEPITGQSLTYRTDFIWLLEEVISRLQVHNPNARLVIIMDEAHLMNRLEITFQEVIREAFNRFVKHVRAVLACYYDFFDASSVSGSPLHNIFDYIFLMPLQGDDLRSLIQEPGQRFGYTFESAATSLIMDACGGHPYYAQFVCHNSLAEAMRSDSRIITAAHASKAERSVIASDLERFRMGYWKQFGPDERRLLHCVIHRKPTADQVPKHVIRRLKNMHVLRDTGKHLSFTARLFEVWCKQLLDEYLSESGGLLD
jgi:hypothetical protein